MSKQLLVILGVCLVLGGVVFMVLYVNSKVDFLGEPLWVTTGQTVIIPSENLSVQIENIATNVIGPADDIIPESIRVLCIKTGFLKAEEVGFNTCAFFKGSLFEGNFEFFVYKTLLLGVEDGLAHIQIEQDDTYRIEQYRKDILFDADRYVPSKECLGCTYGDLIKDAVDRYFAEHLLSKESQFVLRPLTIDLSKNTVTIEGKYYLDGGEQARQLCGPLYDKDREVNCHLRFEIEGDPAKRLYVLRARNVASNDPSEY